MQDVMQELCVYFTNRDPLTTISDFAGIVTGIVAIAVTVWVFCSQKSQKRQEIFTKLSFELILNFIKPYSDTKKRLSTTLSQENPYEKAEDIISFLEKYPFSTCYSFWNKHKVEVYISYEQIKHIDAYNKVREIEFFIKEAKEYSEDVDYGLGVLKKAANYDHDITSYDCIRKLDAGKIKTLEHKLDYMERIVNNLITQLPELQIEKHLREIVNGK